MMTGSQLESLRKGRGLTRQELADQLGDCSASGIVKWESGVSPVPQWVAEKMLSQVQIELPVEELQHLLDYARHENLGFTSILSQAVREFLQQQRSAKKPKVTPIQYGGPDPHEEKGEVKTAAEKPPHKWGGKQKPA